MKVRGETYPSVLAVDRKGLVFCHSAAGGVAMPSQGALARGDPGPAESAEAPGRARRACWWQALRPQRQSEGGTACSVHLGAKVLVADQFADVFDRGDVCETARVG